MRRIVRKNTVKPNYRGFNESLLDSGAVFFGAYNDQYRHHDLIGGAKGAITGTSWDVTRQGRAVGFDGSSHISYGFIPAMPSALGFTVLAAGYFTDAGTNASVICGNTVAASNGGWAFQSEAYPATGNFGFSKNTVADIDSTIAIPGGFTIASVVCGTGGMRFRVNDTSSTVADTNALSGTTDTFAVGAYARTGSWFDPLQTGNNVITLVVFDRELDDEELDQLHGNIWDLYAPRVINVYAPAAVGGLGIPVAAYHYYHNVGSNL